MTTAHHYLVPDEGAAHMTGGHLVENYRELHADWNLDWLNDNDVWAEQQLVAELIKRGLHPRFADVLSDLAETTELVKNAPPMKLEEAMFYLNRATIGLNPQAAALAQPVGGGTIYLAIADPALAGLADPIIRGLKRLLPDGIDLEALSGELKDEYLRVYAAVSMQLQIISGKPNVVTTAKALGQSLVTSAMQASKVFKSAGRTGVRVPYKVVKSVTHERIVTGLVLEPETPDGTMTEESEADIYSELEITKGMYWWMENAGHAFSYHHIEMGGQALPDEDVIVLENFQARTDYTEGDQFVKKGSWMLTTRVRNEQLWGDILAGKINSWSVGMHCMGQVERVSA